MPRKSPEIDAIEDSSKLIVKAIKDNIGQVIKPVKYLEELPKFFEQLNVVITNRFNDLFKSNLEASVISKQTNIKILENKSGFITTHIEKKNRNAEINIDQVTSSFAGYFQEIGKENNDYLKKLDEHIYQLTDITYPIEIHEKVFGKALVAANNLTDHIAYNGTLRTDHINSLVQETTNSMKHVSETLNRVKNNLGIASDWRNDLNPVDESDPQAARPLTNNEYQSGGYSLQVSFAEIMDTETGQSKLKLYFDTNDFVETHISDELMRFFLDQMKMSLGQGDISHQNARVVIDDIRRYQTLTSDQESEFERDCSIAIIG